MSPPPQPPETPNPTTARPPQNPTTVRPPQNPIYHPPITSNPPHDPTHLRYPGCVSSSNRGFITRPRASNNPRRPFVFSYPDPNPFFFRPPQMRSASSGVATTGGLPVNSSQQLNPKVGGTTLGSGVDGNANGHKQQLRERNKDDVSVTIRDRKVRVNTNGSLYSLCRSWLRNGFPEEVQPHYPDTVKALPKPLPLAAKVANSTDKKEGDKEGDEGEVSVEQLSAKELLQRHVKRAKRIRSRLREERHERITRYKTRLALLLPPIVDQSPLKNETN